MASERLDLLSFTSLSEGLVGNRSENCVLAHLLHQIRGGRRGPRWPPCKVSLRTEREAGARRPSPCHVNELVDMFMNATQRNYSDENLTKVQELIFTFSST